MAGELSHTSTLRHKHERIENDAKTCKYIYMVLVFSDQRPERAGRRNCWAAAALLSKYSSWNTLITQDDYHLPFASLAIDGNITLVSAIMYTILNQFRKRAVQPNPADILKKYERFPSSLGGIICCLYIID